MDEEKQIVYTLPGERPARVPVELTMSHDNDGDVRVKANGITLGWFNTDGEFMRTHYETGEEDRKALEQAGFKFDGDGSLWVYGLSKA